MSSMVHGLILVLTSLATVSAQTPVPAAGPVRPGIEVFLSDVPTELRGKRVGLITNHAGVDRAGTSGIDLIAAHKDLKLVALFAAEHGIRGSAAAGEKIADDRDAKTGVPIFSLYMAEDRGPTSQMLENVDVLVYDLPEVGGRTWTYVSTMALSMQAAARKKIPFVVLDRPNPIGGEIVEGALLDPAFKSFVGMYPIPARHGMTVGELATFFNKEFGIGVDLMVARAANWRRSQWFTDTGLPWRNPSPNLRSPAALNHYPGTVYFEGTNLTEGRGTERPFEQIGAAWLDAAAVATAMNDRRLPGIRFEPITMAVEKTAAKFPGQTIPAIRLAITDREAYRPVRTALLLIDEIRRQHPKDFQWGKSIDRLTGSDKVRLAIDGGTLPALLDAWDREAAAFKERSQPFLLYPDGSDRAGVLRVMAAAADWQLAHPSEHAADDWTQATFYIGMMAAARVLDQPQYLEAMRAMGEKNRWRPGPRPGHADDWAVIATYARLYEIDKDRRELSPSLALFNFLAAHEYDEPLAWGNAIETRELAWCDALFMGPPALAAVSAATGDRKYLDLANTLWWKTTDYLYDRDEHLFFRDSRFFDQREKNGRKVFWSRGNGWVFAGLARMLADMPAGYRDLPRYVALYREMAERVIALQGADGYWRSSLLDPDSRPNPETSGTGLFTFGLAWGINSAVLPSDRYEPAVRKGWAALARAVQPDGRLGWVQRIGAEPGATTAETTEVYGVGALLLAGSEVAKLPARLSSRRP